MDINATDHRGQGLLHMICSRLEAETEVATELRWILDHGGDRSLRDCDSLTPLHLLCNSPNVKWTKEMASVLGMLAKANQDILNDCLPTSDPLIHLLVGSSFGVRVMPSFTEHALQELLDAGASLGAHNKEGETPLTMALTSMTRNRLWTQQYPDELLDAASRLALPDKARNTLPDSSGGQILEQLFFICGGRHPKLLSLLDKLALMPSQMATVLGLTTDVEALKRFIASGVDVTGSDSMGYTPLHIQVLGTKAGLCARLELLIEAGVDPNAVNWRRESAMRLLQPSLALARSKGDGTTEEEELLLRYGYGAEKLDIDVKGKVPDAGLKSGQADPWKSK